MAGKRRSASEKNAFTERLKAEALAPAKAILVPDGIDTDWTPVGEPHFPPPHLRDQIWARLPGEWTKETAVLPTSMRDDPLSVFINTMNLWSLMATGWRAIARASWGLD